MKYCSRFSGNDVVLGPALSVTHERTSDGIPIEQAICKKRSSSRSNTREILKSLKF